MNTNVVNERMGIIGLTTLLFGELSRYVREVTNYIGPHLQITLDRIYKLY